MLNKSARAGTLILFLVLEETFSVFHHWVWCYLCVFHIWPLLCLGGFLFPGCWVFYHKRCWILSNVFSVSVEIIICFFTLNSNNVVYYIDQFSNVELFSHSRNKSHLVMVYNPLMCWIQSGPLIIHIIFEANTRHSKLISRSAFDKMADNISIMKKSEVEQGDKEWWGYWGWGCFDVEVWEALWGSDIWEEPKWRWGKNLPGTWDSKGENLFRALGK